MASMQKQTAPSYSVKRLNFSTLIFIFLLCCLSYFIGIFQNGAGTTLSTLAKSAASTIANRLYVSCAPPTDDDPSPSHPSNPLDAVIEAKRTVFPACDFKYSEYTPCEDLKRSLKFSRENLVYRERHCPAKSELLKCLIPAPHGYKTPFSWPTSRDYAWYANAPHRHLTVEKANQNWIQFKGDRFKFPGGGTMFPSGADAYIDDIGALINLTDGSIRTAIDTGCGVASWGAYLLSRNVLTVSFAPRDTHEAQVQFALERGVPALIGVMASVKLPYPSRAFDMAHCSRCLIPWAELGGMYLMEVDRVLRPGGFWILSGPPIRWKKYWKGWERSEEDLNAEQTAIEETARSLCWTKFVEKGDIAIWQKPMNHAACNTPVPFCEDDADASWNKKMKVCVTRLPEVSNDEEVAGGKLKNWPSRVSGVPPRISRGTLKGVTPEAFKNDRMAWIKRVAYYKTVNHQLEKPGGYRNLLDMNANLGGFAAALKKDPVWVMNVVPAHSKVNTLGAIFERGLIGTYQNWCEAMSTYPRTYDLIHADKIFTLYANRCAEEDILLEMDRILRPEGSVIIRDDVDVLVEIKRVTDGMRWESQILDHEDGPMNREKLLFAVKTYWTASEQDTAKES